MSVDYYLYSPSQNKGVMVGSMGLSGTQICVWTLEVTTFIRWALEESIRDVVLVDEDQKAVMEEKHDPR